LCSSFIFNYFFLRIQDGRYQARERPSQRPWRWPAVPLPTWRQRRNSQWPHTPENRSLGLKFRCSNLLRLGRHLFPDCTNFRWDLQC
jgi:hypothetical protein